MGESDIELASCLVRKESLSALKEIYVDNCGLASIPNVSSLAELEFLDLRNNQIQDIGNSVFPSSLRILLLEDNPVKCLSIDCTRLPQLKTLTCGSENAHFLSFSVVEKICGGELNVSVSHSQHLYLPPGKIMGNTKQLNDYKRNPEKFLSQIPDNKRIKSLFWLIQESGFVFSTLDFDSQMWILDWQRKSDYFGPERYQHVDLKQL